MLGTERSGPAGVKWGWIAPAARLFLPAGRVIPAGFDQGALASPVKDGGPAHAAVIDALIEIEPAADLQDAMDERGDMFDVKVRAVSVVRADRTLPKYKRLGMGRIAWVFRVSERELCEWWAAYEGGGVDALRSSEVNRGREARVGAEVLAEARDALLARNAQAAAAGSARGAKRLSAEEFGKEIKKRTGVDYSRSHLYTLLAALER